jgi:hypothetical protein
MAECNIEFLRDVFKGTKAVSIILVL